MNEPNRQSVLISNPGTIPVSVEALSVVGDDGIYLDRSDPFILEPGATTIRSVLAFTSGQRVGEVLARVLGTPEPALRLPVRSRPTSSTEGCALELESNRLDFVRGVRQRTLVVRAEGSCARELETIGGALDVLCPGFIVAERRQTARRLEAIIGFERPTDVDRACLVDLPGLDDDLTLTATPFDGEAQISPATVPRPTTSACPAPPWPVPTLRFVRVSNPTPRNMILEAATFERGDQLHVDESLVLPKTIGPRRVVQIPIGKHRFDAPRVDELIFTIRERGERIVYGVPVN